MDWGFWEEYQAQRKDHHARQGEIFDNFVAAKNDKDWCEIEHYGKIIWQHSERKRHSTISCRFGKGTLQDLNFLAASYVKFAHRTRTHSELSKMNSAYNPNEDNIGVQGASDDERRDNLNGRWLLTWTHSAKYSKMTGGRVIQVRSQLGLSDMQRAEEEIAQLIGVPIVVFEFDTRWTDSTLKAAVEQFAAQAEPVSQYALPAKIEGDISPGPTPPRM